MSVDPEEALRDLFPLARALAARRARETHVDRDELESAATWAMVEAVRTFDATRGASLRTHATRKALWRIADVVRAEVRRRRASSRAAIELPVPSPRPHDGLLSVALSVLEPRLAQVIRWRYVDELTFAEIGARLGGKGKGHAFHLHERAIEVLRVRLEGERSCA